MRMNLTFWLGSSFVRVNLLLTWTKLCLSQFAFDLDKTLSESICFWLGQNFVWVSFYFWWISMGGWHSDAWKLKYWFLTNQVVHLADVVQVVVLQTGKGLSDCHHGCSVLLLTNAIFDVRRYISLHNISCGYRQVVVSPALGGKHFTCLLLCSTGYQFTW